MSSPAHLSVLESPAVEELSGAVPVPDVYVLVAQILGICRALHEPQQLLRYSAPEHLSCMIVLGDAVSTCYSSLDGSSGQYFVILSIFLTTPNFK